MIRWYIPSWCGDFRLEQENGNPDACRLIVVDPTPAEVMQLGTFLTKARSKGWVPKLAGVAEKGESTLLIKAPVAKAGKLFLGWRGPRKDLLTAIKSHDGKIIPVLGNGEALEKAVAAESTKEAATVKRPTPCCPDPVTGPDIRASQVLQAFCTPKQWTDWLKHGFLVAYGRLTGHPYRICHRHTELARQQGKITWDLHDDNVLHCYDWSVPPAEEVLGVKLVLEHAEHWLRNASGYFTGTRHGYIFHSPLVGSSHNEQFSDGTSDTAFMSGMGAGLRAYLSFFGVKV